MLHCNRKLKHCTSSPYHTSKATRSYQAQKVHPDEQTLREGGGQKEIEAGSWAELILKHFTPSVQLVRFQPTVDWK